MNELPLNLLSGPLIEDKLRWLFVGVSTKKIATHTSNHERDHLGPSMTLKVVRLVEDFRSNNVGDEASDDGNNERQRADTSLDD